MHFARRVFRVLYAARGWMPARVRAHLNRIGFYNGVLRAFRPDLPPVTLRQVFGAQSLHGTAARSTHCQRRRLSRTAADAVSPALSHTDSLKSR